MTESKARQLVQDYLDRLSADEGYYVILRIIEKKYGWVIYWNTKKYAESGNRADGEIGTGPLVIENSSGSIYSLSSGINQVKILCDFEKAHGYTS